MPRRAPDSIDSSADLIIEDAHIATMGTSAGPRLGAAMNDPVFLRGDVAVRGGKIAAIGKSVSDDSFRAARVIKAGGRLLTPGLVDPHTHAVFAGTREDEFELRNSGIPYAEIAKKGGGIRKSVGQVRKTSKTDIVARARNTFNRMVMHGTTTAEVKSGYGLSLDEEVKLLEAAIEVGDEGPLEVLTTFLGAHEVPEEFAKDRAGYVKLLCETMIPEVAKKKLADFCDVFCEKGVFEIEDSRRILEAAKKHGLDVRLHAEEFATLGGAELAAEVGAASADHLMAIDEAGIAALKKSGTVAILLPGTTFFLGLPKYAPARKLIDAGVAVGLATDCNPGSCYTESLQIIFTIAATQLHMTAAEILAATTVNAAHSLRIGDRVGRIAPGLQADLVLWQADDLRQLPYHFGVNLAGTVIKHGKVVFQNDQG